jgi:hypothetical protein
MEQPPTSNAAFLLRIMVAITGFGTLAFTSGFFGPLYLREDAGVGPVTGFLAAPIGALIGAVTAIHASVTTTNGAEYWRRVIAVAIVLTAIMLVVVASQ